jgi:hypothetical protein
MKYVPVTYIECIRMVHFLQDLLKYKVYNFDILNVK